MEEKGSIRLLFSFFKDQRSRMLLSVFLSIIGEILGLFPYYGVSRIILDFYYDSLSFNGLAYWIGAIIMAHAIRFLITWKATMLSHRIAFSVLNSIRKKLVKKMFNITMGDVISRTIGEWKNLIVDHVSKLEDSLAHIIPEFVSSIVAPLVAMVFIFSLNWKMGLMSLVTIPIGMLFYLGIVPGYKDKMSRYTEASKMMNGNLVEYINGIEVIKAFAKGTSSYEKFSSSIVYYHDTTMDWWRSAWFYNAAARSVMPSTLLATLPYATYLLMNGDIGLDVFVICIVLPISFVSHMLKIATFLDEFGLIKGSLEEIRGFLDMKEMVKGYERLSEDDGGYSFENVVFSYENKPVLNNISFTANKGELTAIVGPSGSGKSTIAKLMAGFWQPQKGKIKYGEADLSMIREEDYIEQISYVAQDNFLFNTSIAENIMMARPEASMDDIDRACAIANCKAFIENLPNGFSENVGNAGTSLSGGERQRISLARAVLKDSPMLILDEATAHADPETDYLIQESINRMIRGKSMVVVAHRLATIVNADKILVIDEGQIVGQGRHDELLSSCALYKSMWNEYVRAGAGGEGYA
jgi:ATP-binding cassette subfamily B protein